MRPLVLFTILLCILTTKFVSAQTSIVTMTTAKDSVHIYANWTGTGTLTANGKKITKDEFIDIAVVNGVVVMATIGDAKLTHLRIGNNSLTTLDITKCHELTELKCEYNLLIDLDVGNCPLLTSIDCSYNFLKALDVTRCPKLIHLWCNDNSLSVLAVTKNPKLNQLKCERNSLTELDVTNCPELEWLYCNENSLTELDVTNCPGLTKLYCNRNALSALDVTNCMKLTELSCNENYLTTLDVSNCQDLELLRCNDNSLSTLDVTNCPKLKELRCNKNFLTALDLTNCPELESLSAAGQTFLLPVVVVNDIELNIKKPSAFAGSKVGYYMISHGGRSTADGIIWKVSGESGEVTFYFDIRLPAGINGTISGTATQPWKQGNEDLHYRVDSLSAQTPYSQKSEKRSEFISDSEHAIIVEQDGKYGIMSSFSGKKLTPVKYDSIFSCYEYSGNDNRVIVVEADGHYGLVDEQTGKEVLSPAKSPITAFSDEVVFPFAPLKWTINGKETFLHSPVYDTITHDAGNGCKVIYHKYRLVIRGYEAVCEKYRVGMINESGELFVPVEYTSIKDSCFRNGFSIVEVEGKQGVIDSTGMEIVSCLYDDIWWSGSRGGRYVESNWRSYDLFDDPLNQNSPVWPIVAMKNEKMGVVSKSGEEIVSFDYDDIQPAIEHTISKKLYVKKNNKWGIIDFEENIVMPFIELDLAPVILTEKNNIIIKGRKDGKWGLLNAKGDFILPAVYYRLYLRSSNKNENTFLIVKGDRLVEIDIKGNLLIEIIEGEEVDEAFVFSTVNEIPEFPGGDAALYKWLHENLRYPAEAIENDIEDKVLVDFLVHTDGSVAYVSVLSEGVHELLKDEATRIVKRLPKWKPCSARGKPVHIRCTIPIEFRLIRKMQRKKQKKTGIILIHEINTLRQNYLITRP